MSTLTWMTTSRSCLFCILLSLTAPLVQAGLPGKNGAEALAYHGRRQRDYHFQATVLPGPGRKITMLTRSPDDLEVVETEQGKRFFRSRFAVEKVKLLEKRPPERPEDTFVVTVNDSLTHRVFVLNQGALVAWPEYYAALSWSKGGQVFLTREGSQFSSPSGAKKFQVCLIDEESVVIAPTDAPLKRLRIPRAGATSSSLSSARSQP